MVIRKADHGTGYNIRYGRIVRLHTRWYSFLVLCMFLLLVGCNGDSITVPTSDGTPPTIELFASAGAIGNYTLTPSSNPVTLTVNENTVLSFLATATDEDGGIKNVSISIDMIYWCKADTHDTRRSMSLQPGNPSDGGIGSEVSVTRQVTYIVKTKEIADACPAGMWLGSLNGVVTAKAENFHGGVVETVVFTFEYE